MMYTLYELHNAKLPIAQSSELVTLWEMLDNSELKYKMPVIVDDNNQIVAGHESAFEWAKHREFKV